MKKNIDYWYATLVNYPPGGKIEDSNIIKNQLISQMIDYLEKENQIEFKIEEVPGIPGQFSCSLKILNFKMEVDNENNDKSK